MDFSPLSSSSFSSSSSSSPRRFGPISSPRPPKLITVFLRCSPSSPSFGFGLTLEGSGPAKVKVIDGGIAHQNGLKSDDELLAIDRENVAGLGHLEVVAKMRKVMRRRREAWLTVRRLGPSSSVPLCSSPPRPSLRLPFHRKWLPSHRSHRYKKCRLFSPPPASFVQKCGAAMPSLMEKNCPSSPKFRSRRSSNCASTVADIPSPLSPISNVSGTSPVLSPLSSPSPHLLVAQWVLQYLGQFGDEQSQQKQSNYCGENGEEGEQEGNGPSQWVDKALLFLGQLQSQNDEQSELCVLNVFEDKLTVCGATAPSVASIPFGRVRAVGRSRIDSRWFGVLISSAEGDTAADASDTCPSPVAPFAVLLFRCVPHEFAQHHEAHAHFAREMGIKCRRKLTLLELSAFSNCSLSAAPCVQFPLDCAEVLASLRFGIPPSTVSQGNKPSGTVAKFMAKLAEGLAIGEKIYSKEWDRTDCCRRGKGENKEEEDDEDNTSTTDSMNTIVDFDLDYARNNQPQQKEQGEIMERQESRPFQSLPLSSSASFSVQLVSSPAPIRPHSPPPTSVDLCFLHAFGPNDSKIASFVPTAKCQSPRPMPPPLPPKPRFLTQSKAPSFSADFGISSLFPVGISSASSSAAAPNEFVGSDRHRAGAQPNQSSAFLKATTEEKEEEDVEASKVPISEQYLQHNLTNCYKVPTTTAFSVASFALSRNCENKENREPAPTADSAGKAKEQTQAEVKGESAKQRIGHQIGQGRATQPKQQQKHRPTDPSPPRVAHPPQQRMPEAAMPSAPSDGSPKQQPDSSVDLEQVLKSEVARAPFHQFLQQQFCAENINFYLAVEEYKKIPEIEFGRRTDFGRQIFDRHFAANCIEPVNIDNSTSNQIREAYKKNRFTSEVYDVVQYQIFHLLKYDCWPRYLRAGGQLAEEFGGDSKSHDSGASTSQQCLVVGTGNGKQSQPRRKSLFRFLMKSAKTSGTDIASYSGRIDDAEEADACCTCTVAEHQRQHLFGALNGCSVRAVLLRRAHSRSPSRVGLRRTRRSCTERTTASAASVAAAHAAALMLSASVATSSIGEGKDADESAASRAEATEGVQQQQQQEHRRRCTCRCRRCRKAAIDQFCEPKPDFPLRFCTLLCADSATSTEIALSDPFQSVKQWATAMAEGCGLDKHACEVVDAQTGSTIDPVRQAVDALNKRVVRIIPVVKLPVLFLAPSSPCVGAKPSSPMAAKVVILRCRPALTVGKVLRPIMAKYNVDSEQMVVCIAGTCEVLKLQTPVNAVFLKILAVMSQQQFAERKVMPKREYQKELTMVPSWMTGVNTASTLASSSASLASGQSSPGPDSLLPPFHQHGDVGFCELPLEAESTSKLGIVLLKHSATRSYSSNPREFFKFGRKPTMAKARGGLDQQQLDAVTGGAGAADNADSAAYPSGSSGASQLRYRKSGGSGMGSGRSGTAAKEAESRRKSLGAAAAANAIATGAILHRDSPLGTPTGSITGVSTSGRLSSAMAVGLVAPSDIPYCGEVEPPEEPPLEQETCSTYAVHSTLIRHEQVYGTKSAVITSTDRKGPFKSEDSSRNRSAFPSGANGSPASTASPLPAIFSSTVRSDKNGAGGGINASPSTETMVWQKADYV